MTEGSAKARATSERLLDAAERLFGEFSYDGVGMRMLAEKAGVNLNAATYHFGSKKNLYIATFMRRFRPDNAIRLQSLREAEERAGGKPLPIEEILECLLRSPFESGMEHPAFHRFQARNMLMPPPFIHAAIIREVEPVMALFAAALKRSLPEFPEDLIHLRMMFAMGTLLMFSMHANEIIPGIRDHQLHETFFKEIVRYVSAGFKSPAAVPPSERPPLPVPPRLPKR
jgi:AcrR family transcriptional regulator